MTAPQQPRGHAAFFLLGVQVGAEHARRRAMRSTKHQARSAPPFVLTFGTAELEGGLELEGFVVPREEGESGDSPGNGTVLFSQ